VEGPWSKAHRLPHLDANDAGDKVDAAGCHGRVARRRCGRRLRSRRHGSGGRCDNWGTRRGVEGGLAYRRWRDNWGTRRGVERGLAYRRWRRLQRDGWRRRDRGSAVDGGLAWPRADCNRRRRWRGPIRCASAAVTSDRV
jgi:hypothetical protein